MEKKHFKKGDKVLVTYADSTRKATVILEPVLRPVFLSFSIGVPVEFEDGTLATPEIELVHHI